MNQSRAPEPSEAASALGALLYQELHLLAQRALRGERSDHTLQPTALVHEAYLRLVRHGSGDWESRRHFMSVAGMAMRQLLADYARRRSSQKRGGVNERVEFDELSVAANDSEIDLVALDDALTRLKELDERQARIVELRFLAGLTVKETADVLDVAESTVYLDWNMARSWLDMQLGDAN